MTDAALATPEPAAPERLPERLGVISWESGPRKLVTVYLPLACFVIVLLFPFYWMTITTFKRNNELYNYKDFNPLFVHSPTLANVKQLFFDTDYPRWLWTTMLIAASATALSIFASVLAAYAIQRLRFRGANWVGLADDLACYHASPLSSSSRSPRWW